MKEKMEITINKLIEMGLVPSRHRIEQHQSSKEIFEEVIKTISENNIILNAKTDSLEVIIDEDNLMIDNHLENEAKEILISQLKKYYVTINYFEYIFIFDSLSGFIINFKEEI